MFYKKQVLGQFGNPFTILKIEGMVKGAEDLLFETISKCGIDEFADPIDDPRVTRLGKLIRPRHIDEFPQVLNYLAGQMDLVGTRARSADDWKKYPVEHMQICLNYRPGLLPSSYYHNNLRDLKDTIASEQEYYVKRAKDPNIDKIYLPVILKRSLKELLG